MRYKQQWSLSRSWRTTYGSRLIVRQKIVRSVLHPFMGFVRILTKRKSFRISSLLSVQTLCCEVIVQPILSINLEIQLFSEADLWKRNDAMSLVRILSIIHLSDRSSENWQNSFFKIKNPQPFSSVCQLLLVFGPNYTFLNTEVGTLSKVTITDWKCIL